MKIYEITKQSNLTKLYEADVLPTEGIFSKLGKAFISTLRGIKWLSALVMPFAKYESNMKIIEDNLKKAGNTSEALADYENNRNMQIGLLVTEITAALLITGAFASLTGFLGLLRFVPGVGPIIANSINLLSYSAQIWIYKELSSEEGRKKIAELIVTMTHGYGNTTGLGHLADEAHTYFENLFKRAIHEATGYEFTHPGETPDATVKPTDPATPEEDSKIMATLFGTNQPVEKELPVPGEYLGPKLQRNPTTGKIEMKPLQ